MAIKLANVSFIRRSAAEVCVLRELISLKRFDRAEPSEAYLALVCQMREEQVRKALGKLAKSGLISYTPREWNVGGSKTTEDFYVLHNDKIRQLIAEGEELVFKTLREIHANSQRGNEGTSQGESIREEEGKGGNDQGS